MKIYDIEKRRGLENKIKNDSKSAIAMNHSVMVTEKKTEAGVKADFPKELADINKENLTNDLIDIYSIMVSTNWNKNDDVFTADQMSKTIKSPLFKPANYQHNSNEVNNETIGVIHAVYPVDENYQVLAEENLENEYFHLLIGTYVWYKYFPTYASDILEGINTDSMFVSMECFFQDFGYALRKSGSEEVKLLNRDEDTAWLSSYLRIYGGPGTVTIKDTEYQVGRWLKDFTFSGVGFVNRPANPESIIFDNYSIGGKCIAVVNIDDPENYSIECEKNNLKKIAINSVFNNRQTCKGNLLWPIT